MPVDIQQIIETVKNNNTKYYKHIKQEHALALLNYIAELKKENDDLKYYLKTFIGDVTFSDAAEMSDDFMFNKALTFSRNYHNLVEQVNVLLNETSDAGELLTQLSDKE